MKKQFDPDQENVKFTPLEQLSYEQALVELEEIVNALEANEKTLGEAMAYYQRGQELARYCAAQLDEAELKIQLISGEELIDFEQA
jgi:exodeoxyribonuclease VII small subunit